MITLGIETSGRAGSIALVRTGELLAERELSATGRRHARTLVPEIGRLLTDFELRALDVNVVAVSVGPGSFTGLRVGVVCAKTFAFATGCQIAGIDTFQAIAAACKETSAPVWVIDDALRGDLFAGEYQWSEEQSWQAISPPKLLPATTWHQAVHPGQRVTGPGIEKLGEEFSSLNFSPAAERFPRAAMIAFLGEARARSGDVDDPWGLEPFYMRRSAAEEKADPV